MATSGAKRRRLGAGIVLVVLGALLFVPDPTPVPPPPAGAEPFVWGRGELWAAPQTPFEKARADGCERTTHELEARLADFEADVKARIEVYREARGGTPPYWDLVAMSREALAAIDS